MTSYSSIPRRFDRTQAYLYLKGWTNKLFNPNTNKDALRVLLLASIDNDYVEGCAKSLHACGQTVRNHLKQQNPQSLLQVNQQVIHQMKQRGALNKPIMLAVDWHDEMYYGDPKAEGVVGAQPKHGSSYAYRFATASVLLNGERLTLALTPMLDKKIFGHAKRLLDCVFELGVKVKLVLFDRGYYSIELIQYLQALNVGFIIPLPELMKGLVEGEDKPYRTKTHKKRSSQQVSFRLVTLRDRGKFYIFGTNTCLGPKRIRKSYRRRWGIETSYRMIGIFLAKTTSKLYRLRQLYFFLAVVLYNLWVLRNFRRRRSVSAHSLVFSVRLCLALSCLPDVEAGG